MVLITTIAQRILNENGYSTSDISLVNLEYLIDNAIDYVNMEAGTSIADLGGAAAAKTLTGSEPEIFMVKTLSGLMIRAYKEHGPQVGLSSMSISLVSTDPNFKVYWSLFQNGLNRLRGKSFERV